jgi:hypothetical protein
MKRQLFTLASALLLVLCGGCWGQQNQQLLESGRLLLYLATAMVWVRSYWVPWPDEPTV